MPFISNRSRPVEEGMGRPKLPANERKKKVTITPAPEVLDFLDARIGLGKLYKDRTHAFEQAVACLMQNEKHKKT